jgi:hypothetical protein
VSGPDIFGLIPVDADDATVAAWIERVLTAMDQTPRNPRWRYRATGMTMAEALGQESLREARLDVKITVGEARMVHQAAAARGIATRAYMKQAIGTVMAVCDGVPPGELPSLLKHGLVKPR